MDRIPILKLGDALLVTIQVDMHDRLAMALEEDLTTRIVATRAQGVLIDISALEIVDSFIGRMLDNIAAELNSRPRKRHAFKTPAEMLNELLSANIANGVA